MEFECVDPAEPSPAVPDSAGNDSSFRERNISTLGSMDSVSPKRSPEDIERMNREARRRFDAYNSYIERREAIESDPMNAPLAELSWLVSSIEENIRQPPFEEAQLWDHRQDPDGQIWLANETAYLDFLLKLIPARASLEAAEMQNAVQRELVETNRDLVDQNKKLARESRTSATASIVIAIGSIAALVTTVMIFVANLPTP